MAAFKSSFPFPSSYAEVRKGEARRAKTRTKEKEEAMIVTKLFSPQSSALKSHKEICFFSLKVRDLNSGFIQDHDVEFSSILKSVTKRKERKRGVGFAIGGIFQFIRNQR